MDGCNFDRPRNVIPRWRKFVTAVEVGELGTPPREAQAQSELPTDLARRLAGWRPADAAVYSADLLSAALVAGREEMVGAAAQELLKNEDPKAVLQRIAARRALSGCPPPRARQGAVPPSSVQSTIRTRIIAERSLLRYSPDNPIAWTELAHAYTAIGERAKAERCLRAACQLAPDNRFVLRSATRFWIHAGDAQRSLWLLRRSARTRVDPWLLAAELAASRVCDQPPRDAKKAERLLERRRGLTIHLSELAAALAMLEFQHGHMRRARNLFFRALEQPTENALSQAIYFNDSARSPKLDLIIQSHLSVPRGYEAVARVRYSEGVWDQAVEAYENWLGDEPFATRPAVDGSFVATLALEDHERAVAIAKRGLRANPGNRRLENNLAVAQLHLNQIPEAARIVARLPARVDNARAQASMTATRGLLAFREGEPEQGARLYLEAADEASANGLVDVEERALLIGAVEAINAGLPDEHPLVQKASTRSEGRASEPTTVELLRQRVRRAMERRTSPCTAKSR